MWFHRHKYTCATCAALLDRPAYKAYVFTHYRHDIAQSVETYCGKCAPGYTWKVRTGGLYGVETAATGSWYSPPLSPPPPCVTCRTREAAQALAEEIKATKKAARKARKHQQMTSGKS